MLNEIFNSENGLWRRMGILIDLFAFSMVWLVCTATVVALGPETTALCDAMARNLRGGELGRYVRFWEPLKANFKVVCPAGLPVAARAGAALCVGMPGHPAAGAGV